MLARPAGDDLEDRVEATTLALRAAAIEAGMRVSGDGRITEGAAGELLQIEVETLQKKRAEGKGPPFYRVALDGARLSYKISDLARWVEEQREDF